MTIHLTKTLLIGSYNVVWINFNATKDNSQLRIIITFRMIRNLVVSLYSTCPYIVAIIFYILVAEGENIVHTSSVLNCSSSNRLKNMIGYVRLLNNYYKNIAHQIRE